MMVDLNSRPQGGIQLLTNSATMQFQVAFRLPDIICSNTTHIFRAITLFKVFAYPEEKLVCVPQTILLLITNIELGGKGAENSLFNNKIKIVVQPFMG